MDKISSYLPSKKFLRILGAIVTIVIVFFIVKYFWNRKGLSFGQLTVDKIAVQTAIEKDTDKDGIADWEEVLWGTDPSNQKTYAIPDSDYIQTKKNTAAKINADSGAPTTENDMFSKEFLATFASLAASNTLTKENIEQLAQKYSQEVAATATDIKDPYTAGKIKIGGTLSQYKKDLADTLNPYLKKGVGGELSIIQKNIDAEGVINTDPIKAVGVTYTGLGEALIKMTVPREMIVAHLAFANSSAIMGSILTSFSVLDTDSFSAIVAFSHYPKASETFYRDLETIVKILEDNGIIK